MLQISHGCLVESTRVWWSRAAVLCLLFFIPKTWRDVDRTHILSLALHSPLFLLMSMFSVASDV
jgi:hypothetical protein